MNQSENEAIAKAIAALENAKQTLDDESLSLNRNLDHIEAHINAALSDPQPSPARVEAEALVKRLREHEENTESFGTWRREVPAVCTDAAAFIARHHLGEKS